jgi:RNA-directed DNA polymerase
MTGSTHGAQANGADAGAPPANEATWEQINWDQVVEEVTRLQARIAKATQGGRWNKVQALQRLLTHSRSGKLLAVRRVTENKGKRTAGVDWGSGQLKVAGWPVPACAGLPTPPDPRSRGRSR